MISRKTIWVFVAVVVSIVVVLGFILPRMNVARFGESEVQCAEHLESTAKALTFYKSKYHKLPGSLRDLEEFGVVNATLMCQLPTPTTYVYTPADTNILVKCEKHRVNEENQPYRITSDLKPHTFRN